MLSQFVDLLTPMGLWIIALYVVGPIAFVVLLVFAIRADFRQYKSDKVQRIGFPIAPKSDSTDASP